MVGCGPPNTRARATTSWSSWIPTTPSPLGGQVRLLCDRRRASGPTGSSGSGRAVGLRPLHGAAQRRRRHGRDERQRHPLPGPGGRRRRPGVAAPLHRGHGRRGPDRRLRGGGGRRGAGRPAWTWARPDLGAGPAAGVRWTAGAARWMWATPTWCWWAPTRPRSTWRSSGPLCRGSSAKGLNVEFIAVGPGRDALVLRVWERGVGETLACGTGSVAAAAAAHELGPGGPRPCDVHNPGGTLRGGPGADATVRAGRWSSWPVRCARWPTSTAR
jgi:hypothetical protein